MSKAAAFIISIIFLNNLYGQGNYWQQQVNFSIDVSLNDNDHTLDGIETIEYSNNSPDTLQFIWFPLYPNAYKNDRTAFSEQMLRNGSTAFYFSKPEDKGYINRLDFKVNNVTARLETSENTDVAKVILPSPLLPGKKAIINTPFHVKLPYNFSRGGHIGNDYQITQWFPKPAAYDEKGWHAMPYLDQGEFYSEFGSFDVEVTAPATYLIAATGVLQDAETLKELRSKGKHAATTGSKTWHFKQDNVHDFAWFASKDFTTHYDTVGLPSGKIVEVYSYYKPNNEGWKKSVVYAKDGLRKYSEWIGDYPYSIASVVQGSLNENSGGMEYPTITLITTQAAGQELDATIVHEIGHNWFYGALASNERQHAWMDEGMNTFYQKRYEAEKYKTYAFLKQLPKSLQNRAPDDLEELLLRIAQRTGKEQPIETPSEEFTEMNYGLIAYYKASRWLKQLENNLGKQVFDKAMQQYYNDWKFKHPYPEDFKRSIETASSRSLNPLFEQLLTTGPIELSQEKRELKRAFLFNNKDTKKYNYVSLLPAIGYNNYDKLMLGALVHNYQLPLNNFRFIAGALYATGSKKLNEFGRVSYEIDRKNVKIEPAVSIANFSINRFVTDHNKEVIPQVSRVTPSLKLTAKNRNVTTSRTFSAQWKTFLIKEEELNFYNDIRGTDTIPSVNTKPTNRAVNRLSLNVEDTRVLYPYTFNLTTDQSNGFLRAAFTAKYYFNYQDGKTGLQARLFAGKFFYLKERTFIETISNDRYFLNMSGPTGYEDYTYSNYFLGRREFQGFMSQQIMERDGFFKVRSDILSEEIGKTDNWLVSMNLVTDLPDNLNPLSILPIKIPIKIFVDAGTYADANKRNGGAGRFLYDAGFQVSLIGSFINVYFPVLYSKVYRDFFKSTITEKRFAKNIAFTLDLEKLKPTKALSALGL